MSFNKNLIFAYCQPVSNLFCGSVYCVVGQIGKSDSSISKWSYKNKQELLEHAAFIVEKLEEEGNIEVYTTIITPNKINKAGIKVDRYIQQNIRMLVWRYVYKHKIKQPQVRFCGESIPFDTDQIEFITSYYIEEEIIKAIAYLKRHSLIDIHYATVYKDCDLLNNYGIMNLDSLPTIKKAEYRADFFLRPVLLVNLPKLMIDGFEYIPDKPTSKKATKLSLQEKQKFDYYLLNEESTQMPDWWDFVQDVEYHDVTKSDEYIKLKKISINGHDRVDFDCWLYESKTKLEPHCAQLLDFKEYDPEKQAEVSSCIIFR